MLRLALRAALSRPGRLLRTMIAIAVGVGFVSGTYVLTDTTRAAFDRASSEQGGSYDLVVRSVAPFRATGSVSDREPLPDDLIDRVAAVAGVAGVDAGVVGYAQVVAPDGTAITPSGPPTLGTSWGLDQPADELVSGRPPQGPDEVVLDERTFRNHHFALGGEVEILFVGPARRFTVVGVHDSSTLLGATLAVFDLETAQTVLAREGFVDQISVAVADGADTDEVRSAIAAVLDTGQEVVSDDQNRREAAETWTDALGFLTTVLLLFAGVALLVAAFLIFNTFSILLTQRIREFGLLRAIGAGRGQVARSVLAEALVVGTGASVVGLGLGVAAAVGMVALVRAIGIDLPSTGPVLQVRTVVVAIVAGVVTSVAAAVLPALRAGRLTPMVALAGGDAAHRDRVGRRVIAGAALLLSGAALVAVGLWGGPDDPIRYVGPGAALAFLGLAAVAPALVAPVSAAVGAVLARIVGEAGALGRQNAVRDARRTAATASALMIGIGLVGFVAILADSVKASAVAAIDDSITADLIVMPEGTFAFGGFSPEVGADLAALPEVAAASPLRAGQFGLDGAARSLVAVDPGTIGRVVAYEGEAAAAFAALTPNTLAVSERAMASQGWQVGDVVEMTFARTGAVTMPIVGTFSGNNLETDTDYLVSLDTHTANFTESLDAVVYLDLADGVPAERGRAAVAAALAPYPNVRVVDMAELKRFAADQVDQLLAMTTVLLALSLLIAFIGIANTLALSIAERTRELGLLRAVGMSRRQLKRMVRAEATIVAVLGVGLGVLASLALSWAVIRSLADLGISEFEVPWPRMLLIVVVGVLAAGVAASGPARRAAGMPILDAVTGR